MSDRDITPIHLKAQHARANSQWWKNCCIGGITFSTRKQLETHIRSIVNSVPNGKPLSEDNRDFMMAVLQHHPDFVEKVQGAYAIVVDKPDVEHPAQRCFWFHRTDGSRIDISWHVALNGSHRTKLSDLNTAMRNAVNYQVEEERSLQSGTACQICGEKVHAGDMDHKGVSFAQIRDLWLGEQQLDVKLVDVGTSADFADKTLKADWAEFHRIWADLRLIHPECHKAVTNSVRFEHGQKGATA